MILIWIIGILVLLIAIFVLINIFKNWKTMMNYKNLFTFLIMGGVPLTILFTFTSENILIRIISYTILIIVALFYGAFKKRNS